MNESQQNPKPVILIADDEAMIRTLAAGMLERAGYVVLSAENGYRALEMVDEFAEDIDLVFCDIRMPGPSGVQLREMILSKRPATKVVLLSGDTSFANVPTDVPTFPKPFTVQKLRQFVRDILEGAR